MMNLINWGDFLEFKTKIRQKGAGFFLSKLSTNARKRTQSTFSGEKQTGSNWWIISEVKERENQKISGSPSKTFDQYLAENYFQGKETLKLLSIACGSGNREIRLAESGHFKEVTGIDLSSDLIKEASKSAAEKKLDNIHFQQADFYAFDLPINHFDVILFHSSLHHFKNIDQVASRVKQSLKDDGLLIINEYVGRNRLQFSKDQLAEMNRLLKIIPPQMRKRYLTNITKQMVYAPGLLRMIISDPSEAIESETILPTIHKQFQTVEEKKTGGDLLMMVLKDISHHFVSERNPKSKELLDKLFREEDNYLRNNDTNFVFGIYRKKPHA